MTWLDKILPLIGVVIGALITPWVTNRIERAKTRDLVKSNIIKDVYIFFNQWKENVTNINNRYFSFRLSEIVSNILIKNELDSIQRAERIRQFEILVKDIFNMEEHGKATYTKMVETEAEMLSCLSNAKGFLDTNKYNRLSKIIKSLIERSNMPSELHDYLAVDPIQIDNLKQVLPKQLRVKHNEMDAECAKITDELLVLLS